MNTAGQYPEDFQRCLNFHGHVCPGLAIGYAAAKAGLEALDAGRSQDEEIVAIVENDSCAVDAIQVLTGCTFGKGNLIFRDWGKQVYTFFDRSNSKAVRIALKNQDRPTSDQRRELREKINRGLATERDKQRYLELKEQAVFSYFQAEPREIFRIEFIDIPEPEEAKIVETIPCKICGEQTVASKMIQSHGQKICMGCHMEDSD
jgi:formylmethanofuran dehydrogenase subunit E